MRMNEKKSIIKQQYREKETNRLQDNERSDCCKIDRKKRKNRLKKEYVLSDFVK